MKAHVFLLRLNEAMKDVSRSPGTFQTSTGAVSLKGSVTCDNGFTLSSGSFDASASTGAFSTGALDGGTTVTSGNNLAIASYGTVAGSLR
eukprot:Skav221784  [mRNA]  locus=scaffold4067:33982:44285:- [translate_table: standard]